MKRIVLAFLILVLACAARVDAAISFVGSCSTSSTNGVDATLTMPGGVLQNDLVVVAYTLGDNDDVDENVAVSSPAGYTEVSDLFSDDAQEANLGVYYKIQGASVDTSVVVSAGTVGTDGSISAVCMVFRGVDPVYPLDAIPTTASALNTMFPNPPSLSFSSAGVWTVVVLSSGHSQGGAQTYTFPTGYTTDAVQIGSDDTNDTNTGMGYKSSPTSPENPASVTLSGTDTVNYTWISVMLALRPGIVAVAYADTNGLTGTWTSSAGTILGEVDDPVNTPDDDTSYGTTSSGEGDYLSSYVTGGAFSIPGSGNTIVSVGIFTRAKNITDGNLRIYLIIDGSLAGNTSHTLTSSYADHVTTYTTNPCTGVAWTEAQVEATSGTCDFTVGGAGNPGFVLEPVDHTSGSVRVTQAYIVVTYTSSGGGGGGGRRSTMTTMGMD